ncbi:MAG: NAD/FAD-dependent oxidoreductase [Synechococcaceae bacterium WB9_4xC_028]|jgi:predicted NAD/FAD-dependent oxidoreductase|nr:NAD/FAD-dependent oxidoreductase [Synechococcaceae bacterium WB9_4xC_028]
MDLSKQRPVDLAVIGAGLSGAALVAGLRAGGYQGTILVLEAGRGPGGRAATRRRREDPCWRLDHGAPTLTMTGEPTGPLAKLLESLQIQGVLVPDREPVVGLDPDGGVTALPDDPQLVGHRWRGQPTMATVAEALLSAGGAGTQAHYGTRIQRLQRRPEAWLLDDTWQARSLVLTGTLLAHPRSLAMLGWTEVPLRAAVPVGADPQLDQALATIADLDASVRWNLMLELPGSDASLPRQIWLTASARERFGVERLVLQRQGDGRLGLVVHGLDDGQAITPESQPTLIAAQETRLRAQLPELLAPWPELERLLPQARSLGVMRWGAARPTGRRLPQSLQWCPQSQVGFCGDWIAGSGYGLAEGALQSALDLSDQLLSC